MQNQPIPFQYTLPIPMLNSLGSSFHVCFHNPPSAAVNKMVGKSASFLRNFHHATLHPQWHMLPQRLLEEIHRITPVSAQAATGVQLEASKDKKKNHRVQLDAGIL